MRNPLRHQFGGSKFNRDRRDDAFARSILAEAQRRLNEDTKLPACTHCGQAEFADKLEWQWHAVYAECIGGTEKFR